MKIGREGAEPRWSPRGGAGWARLGVSPRRELSGQSFVPAEKKAWPAVDLRGALLLSTPALDGFPRKLPNISWEGRS